MKVKTNVKAGATKNEQLVKAKNNVRAGQSAYE